MYIRHPRVSKVEYTSVNKLIITFINGERRLFDFTPYLNYPVYNSLKNEDFSKEVKVCNGTLCWNESIDFDPDRAYVESTPI